MSMNKTVLAFALAIQLGLVAVLLAARAGSNVDPAPFLSFDADRVDAVTVANAEGTVRLAKAGEAWQLPDGLPADPAKVTAALDKLANAAGGWPVASSAATAKRFEVTAENHQRHVVLDDGDETLADIYLGTSPGYRKVHARRADDDAIYAIAFANYEAGVEPSDWLDKSLLQPAGAVTGLRRVDALGASAFALAKDDDGDWTAASGAALDAGKVATLAGRFTGLTVLDISDAPLPEAPYAGFALDDEEGELTLSLYRILELPEAPPSTADEAQEEEPSYDYLATSNRVPGAFEISSYIAEQMDTTLADLAPEPEAASAEDEAEDAEDVAGAEAADAEGAEGAAGADPEDAEGGAAS